MLPRLRAETRPTGLEAAGKKPTTTRACGSRAYRDLEATRILEHHVVNLLPCHHLLLHSEVCVMLNGSSDSWEARGGGRHPGTEAGAA